MSDFLKQTTAELKDHRNELRKELARVEGLRNELARVERALAQLEQPARAARSSTARRKQTPRRRSRSAPRNGRRREQLLSLFGQHPEGLTIAAAGEKLGLANPTPLYAIANQLGEEGLATKGEDKAWRPVGADDTGNSAQEAPVSAS